MSEKPSNYLSDLAITGLYFFDKNAPIFCENLTKSSRNEFEIIELLKIYQKKNLLNYELLGRGFIWFDAGTPGSLIKLLILLKVCKIAKDFNGITRRNSV